ncbi:hypothetical protein M2H07_21230 [Vibrio vulnificus]|nr:hypothetical protein [Vibrio vulnificus]MCU8199277.1 hypothetical protein [Vibrio vulnificus]
MNFVVKVVCGKLA